MDHNIYCPYKTELMAAAATQERVMSCQHCPLPPTLGQKKKKLNKPVVACLHMYNPFQTSLMVRTNINTTHLNRWRACGCSSRVNPIWPEVIITAALLDFGDLLPFSCPPRLQESKVTRKGDGGALRRWRACWVLVLFIALKTSVEMWHYYLIPNWGSDEQPLHWTAVPHMDAGG